MEVFLDWNGLGTAQQTVYIDSNESLRLPTNEQVDLTLSHASGRFHGGKDVTMPYHWA